MKKKNKYKLKIDPEYFISVSDLRKDLSKYGKQAQKAPVVIVNNSKPDYAIVSLEFLKKVEEIMEDLEDAEIAQRWEKDKDNPDAWITEDEFTKELKNEGIVL